MLRLAEGRFVRGVGVEGEVEHRLAHLIGAEAAGAGQGGSGVVEVVLAGRGGGGRWGGGIEGRRRTGMFSIAEPPNCACCSEPSDRHAHASISSAASTLTRDQSRLEANSCFSRCSKPLTSSASLWHMPDASTSSSATCRVRGRR